MMRVLALLVGLLGAGPAFAQNTQCPGSNASWTASLPAPLSFMLYDMIGLPGVPLGFLTVVQQTNAMDTYIGVPQSVAQGFPVSSNPNQYYATRIKTVYHELLLMQPSNCPLQTAGGALWTR